MSSMRTIDGGSAGRQQPVAATEIAAIVERAFGGAADLRGADELSAGTVNSTWRLSIAGEAPLILRVGPGRDAAASAPSWLPADTLQREHALTPWLAPIAPLLPRTAAADFTHELIDRDWVIQTVVAGRPWSDLVGSLSMEQEVSLWRQLGLLTRRIHAVEGSRFGPLPPGPSFSRWSALLAHDADGIVGDFARFGLPVEPAQRLHALIADQAARLDAIATPRLIHSDLDRRHVFVTLDAKGEPVISGIIDHEFGRFADPLSEGLLLTLALDRPPAAAPFLEGYGAVPDDDETRWRMRLYQAIVLGWTASDLAHQRLNASESASTFSRIVAALAM